jgi:hypothetical protein
VADRCDRCAQPVLHDVAVLQVQHGQLQRPELGMPRFMGDEIDRRILCRPCGSAIARALQDLVIDPNA